MWHWADKRLGVRAAFIFRQDPGMSDFNTIPWKIMILGFTSDTAGENITRFVFCVCKAHNRVWVNLLLTAVRRVGEGVCVRVCVGVLILWENQYWNHSTCSESIWIDILWHQLPSFSLSCSRRPESLQSISKQSDETKLKLLEQIYVWELKISFYSNADFDQGRPQILENVIFPSKCIPVLYLYSY